MQLSTTYMSLVAGDVLGRFKQLFAKVQGILQKNGHFEMLLCVGSFFTNTPKCLADWKEYKEGRESVPIATYILGPSSLEQAAFYEGVGANGGELCSNLTCLGQRGVYTTSTGLQIAYLSGCHDNREYHKSSDENLSPYFTGADVSNVESYTKRDGFKGVDILISSEWPKGVENFTSPPAGLNMRQIGAEPISRLAEMLKPRYHFAGSHNQFYERIPYRNHQVLQGGLQHVTRFISLAHVGNPDKKNRFIYAFSVSPLTTLDAKELTQQPPAVTDCPYTDIRHQMNVSEDLPEQNFFFDPKALSAGKKRKQQQQQRRERDDGPSQAKKPLLSQPPPPPLQPGQSPPSRPPVPRGPCWFCLGSPQFEKHLLVSIGESCYLALPKGGLVPEHVMILPIGHYRATTDAPQVELEELKKFRIALRKYFASRKQSCVIFERNFKSQHLQLQVVPLPQTPSDALRQAFVDHGKTHGIELTEVDRDAPLKDVGVPYFTVEFDEGCNLFVRIRGRFPLQFGREVLASPLILNLPDRVDWKACAASADEETEAAKTMRDHFQPFDFTAD